MFLWINFLTALDTLLNLKQRGRTPSVYFYEQMSIIKVVMNCFAFDSFKSVSVIPVLSDCITMSKCLIKQLKPRAHGFKVLSAVCLVPWHGRKLWRQEYVQEEAILRMDKKQEVRKGLGIICNSQRHICYFLQGSLLWIAPFTVGQAFNMAVWGVHSIPKWWHLVLHRFPSGVFLLCMLWICMGRLLSFLLHMS